MTQPLITLGGLACISPGPLVELAIAEGTPIDFDGRASSYSCPLGKEPGVAWLLLADADLARLGKNAFHALRWREHYRVGSNIRTRVATVASQLAIVRSYAVTLQIPTANRSNVPSNLATGAIRLVELRDRRHIFRMSAIDRSYNVRIPAPPATSGTGLYYLESLNSVEEISGGELWTWQALCDDLWERLPGAAGASPAAGTAPTLPYSPHGNPEGFRFHGQSAWDALHLVLNKIGCTTAYNPITDTFSYVRLGTTQTGLATELNELKSRLIYDYDPGEDYELTSLPQKVRVFFYRREPHGTEKDTIEADTSGNWEMSPTTTKEYDTGIAGARPGTVLTMWDDLPAIYDTAGAISNDAALQARADEVGANLINRISVSEERFRRHYSGLVTSILPGSEVTEVRWRDFSDGRGLVTEVIRRPQDPLAGLEGVNEHLRPPDLSRRTHPLWPRLSQLVRVDDGSSAAGATLSANASGLFPGVVRRWASGAWSNLRMCWIRPVDLDGGATPNPDTVVDLRQLDTFVGRLAGVETHSGDTRQVYLVRKGLQADPAEAATRMAVTDEEIPAHNTGTDTPGTGNASTWEFDNGTISDTLATAVVYNTRPYKIPSGTLCQIHKEVASNRLLIDEPTQHTIEGFSAGADGSETWYPFQKLLLIGDRDQSSAVGNIIDINITRVGDDVKVTFDATGTLFTITDSESPSSGTANIDLGDDLDLSATIDETQLTEWAKFLVTDVSSDPAVNLSFGLMAQITADSGGTVNFFPLELLDLEGGTNVTTAVNKVGNTTTVTINASGTTGGWVLRDNQPSPGPNDVDIDAGETLQFLSAIDETQNDDWLLWTAAEAAPDTMTATFGRLLICEDGDLDTQNLYPRENIRLRGDRDVLAVVGNIITTEVTKAADTVIWDINASGGLFTVADADSPTPGTATLDLADTLEFTTINPAGNTNVTKAGTKVTVEIDLASSGAGSHTIKDGDGDTQTLNDAETLTIRGDRDVSNVLGNFIETEVTKVGAEVFLDVNAAGNMFAFEEGDSPADDTLNVAAGATITLSSTIDEAGLPNDFSQVRISGNNIIWAFGQLFDVTDGTTTATVFPEETLSFKTSPSGGATVSKLGNTTTITIDTSGLPIGAVIQSAKRARFSGGKWYMDSGGVADTKWALMDGVSNSGPGSSIDMQDYFARGLDNPSTTPTNTAYGRTGTALTDDDQVTVAVADHVDHFHKVDADACDDDSGSIFFKFTTSNKRTSGVVDSAGNATFLTHDVNLANHQGSNDTRIQMLPAHKKLHWFEKVA